MLIQLQSLYKLMSGKEIKYRISLSNKYSTNKPKTEINTYNYV